MTALDLNDEELKVIMDEFLYGRSQPQTEEESIFLKKFLSSEKFNELVEGLLEEQANARENPESLNITNAKVYNFDGSYNMWLDENENKFQTHKLENFDSDTVDIFKRKYVKNLLAQFKVGQMIPYFEWPGAQIYHHGASDLGTDMGSCEWVSPFLFRKEPWSNDYGEIETGSYPGEANGLKMILDAEAFDHGRSNSEAVGFKIAILHYLDIPIMDQTGINIDIGKYTQLAVTAKIVKTSSYARRRFEPEVRQCYFKDEIRMRECNLDVGIRYEMTNCLFQAGLDQVRKRCQCNAAPYTIEPDTCQGQNITCMRKINQEMGKWTEVIDTLTNSTKTCIAACDTTSYSNVIVGSSSYPNPATFLNSKESCIIARKLKNTCMDSRRASLSAWYPNLCTQIEWIGNNNAFCSNYVWNLDLLTSNMSSFNFTNFSETLTRYTRENVAMVKLFLREPFAEVLIRSVEISEIDFISSIGGLLGLCMDFSFVTVA